MSSEEEKKGIFGRLVGIKKKKKKSCCCNFEIEEIPEANQENTDEKSPKDTKDN